MTEPPKVMALDRSVRTIDQDGHLHVSMARISRASVNGYLGREIPDADKHGLQPDKIYQLLRHPDELKKAAQTWAGKPLLSKHVPQSADDHMHEIVVGAIGNEVQFDGHFLFAPLTVWDGDAIRKIESGEQKELSSGYRYDYDPAPGVYNGVKYDGVMRNLKANHVSLVEVGRAGPECVVGDGAIPFVTVAENEAVSDPIPDSTPESPTLPAVVEQEAISNRQESTFMATRHSALSRQACAAAGALNVYLRPRMAADAKLDLNPILKPITARNWKASKPKIAAALDKALAGKLAADADISDIIDMLDQLESMSDEDVVANTEPDTAEDADPDDDDDDDEETKKKKAKEAAEKLKEAAADEDNDDDDDEDTEEEKKKKAKEAAEKLKEAAKDRKAARDKKAMDAEPTVTVAAMDAAIAKAVKMASDSAAKAAEKATMARLRSIADAEKAVRPYIGEVSGMDSAEAVYRMALDANAIDLTDVPPAAFPALVRMLQIPGEQKQQPAKTRIAADSAMIAKRSDMFPNANRLRTY